MSIEFMQVSKQYPGQTEPAIQNLNLTIPAGKFTVLLGESGCGKTTTLKMINKMVERSAGEIRINGQDIDTMDEIRLRRGIGYVIQHIGLLPNKTIADNIAIVPKLLGWSKEQIDQRVRELIALFGMDYDEVANRYPRHVSGGQMQRIGVARAMAAKPDVLLMDEPFGAVDPITRGRLQTELKELQTQTGTTICFVTHDIDEAMKLGDAVALFNRGRIEQFDTPVQILLRPASDFVRAFVGKNRILQMLKLVTLEEAAARIGTGATVGEEEALPLPPDTSLYDALERQLESGKQAIAVAEGASVRSVISFAEITTMIREME